MGYTVSNYSLNWSNLASALNGDLPDLVHRVLNSSSGSLITNAVRRGRDADAALRQLIGGSLGKMLAPRGPETPAAALIDASDEAAIAFMALVQCLGEPAGELVHNSKAGSMFRDQFLDRTLPSALAPFDWYLLVDRPLFGFTHPGYPTWGGLKKAECRALWEGKDLDHLPALEDTDEEEWLYSIAETLAFIEQRGTDLVALYY